MISPMKSHYMNMVKICRKREFDNYHITTWAIWCDALNFTPNLILVYAYVIILTPTRSLAVIEIHAQSNFYSLVSKEKINL